MLTPRSVLRTLLQVVLVLALLSGCSAEARKARHLARAEKYFKAGEYEKAKLEYTNVIRIDPKMPLPFKRMATIWLEQGAPLRAGPYLSQVRELAPKDAENRLNLARLFISLGGLAEGRKEAETVLGLAPDNGDALRILIESSRNPAELTAAEQRVQNFPAKQTASFRLAAATLALRKGDVPGAEGLLKGALELDPKTASAHTMMAAIDLMRNDVAKAGEDFKAAAEASPVRALEQIQYEEFQARTGKVAEAVEALKKITKETPDYLPAWRLLGQIAVAEKQYDQTLGYLDNVFKYDSDNVDSRMVQAQALVAKGEGAKAVDVLQRLEKTYPKVPAIKIQLARAHLLNNSPSEAIAALNDALSVDPENVDAKVLMGESNLRAGQIQAVVAGLSDLLKRHPGVGPAQLMLADAYRLLGRFEDAAGIFRDQIRANPQSAPPYLGLGVILREEKKDAEARSAFEKALELSPGNLMAINQLVEMDLADKAYDVAMQRVEALLKTAPQSGSAYLLQGKIYAAQGQYNPAEASLNKALELEPNLAPAYDLLINTYLAANKLPEAASRLETLVARNPNNTAALMQLGLTYEKMGDFAKAVNNYEKVVAIKPDFAAAFNNLAYLYAEKLNQLDKAVDAGRRARTLQPGDPAVADTLGWVLYRQGDYQQALNLLQESAGKLGDNSEVQFHLGSAAYMMGQPDVARTAFHKATEAGKDFPGKEEAQRRLGLLGDSVGATAELAIPDLEALVKQQPNDLMALTRLADAEQKQGQASKAAEVYERVLKINPKLVFPTIKLAQLYAGPLKDTSKALELAKKARELAPTDPGVAAIVGSLAFQSGNFSWAYSLLQEASRQKSDDLAILRDYAWATYAIGKVGDARQIMQRVADSPNAPQAADAKTFLDLSNLDQHPEALSASASQIDAALAKQGDYVPALEAKAGIQLKNGQVENAKETYGVILKRFPDFAPAQKNLARIYAGEPANLAQAYDLATKARKVLSADPDLARTLGEICYKRKEYSRAIQLLQESGRSRPLDAEGLFYLGMSQFQAKQKDPAKDALDRAVAGGLKKSMAEEAQQALKDLQKNSP